MSVYDDIDLPTNTGLYFKFENGVENVIRIASEPITYTAEFKGQESTAYAYLVWNVLEKMPQVMKLPKTALQQIFELARDKDYGDPTKYNLKITRTGEGFQTKYKVTPVPKKSNVPQAVQDQLDKIDPIEVILKGNGVSDVKWLSEVEELKRKKVEPKDVDVGDVEPGDVPFDETKSSSESAESASGSKAAEPAPSPEGEDDDW